MLRRKMMMLFALAALTTLSGFATNASAQGGFSPSPTQDAFNRQYRAGVCQNPWITEAVTKVKGGVTPLGNGDSGECNKRLYGNGPWANKAALEAKVRQTFAQLRTVGGLRRCRDPWITESIKEVTGYFPYGQGETDDCNMWAYVDGNWSSKEQIRAVVVRNTLFNIKEGFLLQPNGRRIPGGPKLNIRIMPDGRLLDSAGSNLVAASKWGLTSSPMVAAGGGNMVAAGAGNIVPTGAGGMVAAGAGNLAQKIQAYLVGNDGASLKLQLADGTLLVVKRN